MVIGGAPRRAPSVRTPWVRTGLVLGLALAATVMTSTGVTRAQEDRPRRGGPRSPAGAPVVVDRVVARWQAPELGGASSPQFVLERQLAFEARIEALASGSPPDATPDERHVRGALDRLIAETLLSMLPVRPAPAPIEVAKRAEAARLLLEDRVGGKDRLVAAARAEGIVSEELDALLRRTARASLYLDRMVAPMFDPSEAELREVHGSGRTPFSSQPYGEVADRVRRWLVARRVEDALDTYYQRARSRIRMVIAPPRTARR